MKGSFDSYMILSDMDGTFFGENASVLENNLEAISYFTKNGGLFTFATGRDFKVLGQQYPNLSELVSCPGVLCNGGYLYDFEKQVRIDEICLNKEETLALIKEVDKRVPMASFRISASRGFLCSDKLPLPFTPSAYENLKNIVFQGRIESFANQKWHKLVYSANGHNKDAGNFIPAVKEVLASINTEHFDVTTSSPTLLEVLPKGVRKSRGVALLKNRFPERTIICVGDYENDRDMLLAADIPACPANALESIKRISKIHLCHHRDGCIADLIYKLDSSNNQSILEE